MAVNWTLDQQQVINARQQNILVSAAAGSGKTAVLVERILSLVMDEKNPVDIDELLIVTFTRAAADEMRERIRKALESARKNNPGNRHLIRQLTLIHSASITTIDSFCMQVVKNHFQEVDLDPAFRVGEEGELKLLMQDVMDELLEDCYSQGVSSFLEFADCYASGKTDKALENLIYKLYQFAQSYPWPEKWLEECKKEKESPKWMDDFRKSLLASIEAYYKYAETALEVCLEPDGPYMYEAAVRSDLEQLEVMTKARTLEELSESICGYQPVRLPVKKDLAVSDTKRDVVKGIRERYKKGLDEIKKKYFFLSLKESNRILLKTEGFVDCLVELTKSFQKRYKDKKKDRNLVDFSDLEHYALQIFLKEENGTRVQTDTAIAYAQKYKEIFIDEYQDSNLVQEILLNSISKEKFGEHNLFMVGDVKQSIYSFRLARPELFIEKYHKYVNGEKGCVRIDLKQNFRSTDSVLGSVNFLFEQLMQPDLGAIAYDEDAALYPGATYSKYDDKQELLLLDVSASGDEDAIVARELEAKMCADRIDKLLKYERVTDKDTGKLRPVRCSDIVILLRTMDGWADVFQKVLEQSGIPCRTTLRSGYFSAYEIQTILNMLRLINNPKQDIPLTAILKSMIGGFRDSELAEIRSACADGSFSYACEQYRQAGRNRAIQEKVDRFYKMLEHFREMVSYTPIHELIWAVLDETGFEAFVAAMPGGAVRRANLTMLADKAMAFERTSYKGVFHFVRYIDRMIRYQVDYGEADVSGDRPDAVEIQSIHKSKGLEYPIVIAAGMGKNFNFMDTRSSVVLHLDHGVGLDYVDPELRTKMPTLKKRAVQRSMRQELIGEELRVLYVAMTRAKEKLILTASVKNLEKEVAKWYAETGNLSHTISYETRLRADSYLDLIMPALLRNKCSKSLLEMFGLHPPKFHVLYRGDSFMKIRVKNEWMLVTKEVDEWMERQEHLWAWTEEVKAAGRDEDETFWGDITWKMHYPWKVYDKLPVKLSVSELKKQQMKLDEEVSLNLYEEEEVVPLVPSFVKEKEEVSGAVRGDVYHRLMELLDFTMEPDMERLSTAVREQIASGRFTEEEYALINTQDILKMLQSSLGKRMRRAAERKELYREQPFVIGVQAESIKQEFADCMEQVLIQGIIDAFFYEEDEIVLMDYKTDRLFTENAFKERYLVQLEYYRKALEQLTGKRVKDIYIYAFTLGRTICLTEDCE